MTQPDQQVIYIVDDDKGVRDSLAFLVESVGRTPESFDSGTAFLAAISTKDTGCVLLDVRMPDMSGLDVQAEIRTRGIDLPVIIITGHADVPLAVRAMRNGAFDLIEKPFNDQHLLDRVGAALRQDSAIASRREELETIRAGLGALTPREIQVMEFVVEGLANKQIAAELGLSIKTIEIHRASVMRKLEATSIADLVRKVLTARHADAAIGRG